MFSAENSSRAFPMLSHNTVSLANCESNPLLLVTCL